MAQIGYGYGSEFQLLRFLGHHRNELQEKIRKCIGSTSEDFYWFDFGYADREKIITGDSELVGLSFLKEKIDSEVYKRIMEKVSQFNWRFDQWQYWDAVFINGDTVYFVEAKAHKDELKSGKKAHGGSNTENIKNFMTDQFPEIVTDEWLKDYYQFANRLSTVSLLNECGLKCKLVYIYFVDGYYDREHNINKDSSEEDFKKEIQNEQSVLGISEGIIKQYLTEVFIDANPQ